MPSAELRAQPGDNVREKYESLRRYIEAQRLISVDDRVIVQATPTGQQVVLRQRPPSVPIPLEVRLSGSDFFMVAEGYINSRLPMIVAASGEEVPLIDPDGQPHRPARLPAFRPLAVVAEVVFKDSLQLEKILITTKRPTDLRKTGTAEYGEKNSLTAHIPLAYLNTGRFIQFTMHNLQVRAYLHADVPRILYWPA